MNTNILDLLILNQSCGNDVDQSLLDRDFEQSSNFKSNQRKRQRKLINPFLAPPVDCI